MAKKADIIIGAILALSLFFLLIIVLFFIFGISRGPELDISAPGDKIAVIELNGIIIDSRDIVRQFKKYGDKNDVKAIVFRVNSPGGGVAPSQEIYTALKRAKEAGKKIIVSMGAVAASGGYYVSSPADTIVANPGTLTGSIGVIMDFPEITKFMEKIGLSISVIKSGEYKDSGSPFRPFTERDRRYFKKVVENVHEQFILAVSQERGLPLEQVKKISDGRVFTGEQALELNLIDVLGSYEDALEIAARAVGIKGKPRLIREKKRRITLFDFLFGDFESIIAKFSSYPQLSYRLY